jgi:hypothetical protein
VNTIFRDSEFMDFNTGTVKIAPMVLQGSLVAPRQRPESLRLFECRVEVWQLGVAVQVLREMESEPRSQSSIWSHAAYGLIAIAFSCFEMIGKTLNPKSAAKKGKPRLDFNFGFCDVYPEYVPSLGKYDDSDVPIVGAFRDRVRNGMYHLAYTKQNLIIHHNLNISAKDFDVKPGSSGAGDVYYLDPHLMVRTIVGHFPGFVQRLRDPDVRYDAMRKKFDEFFDDFHRP